jgi:hypothetical protein
MFWQVVGVATADGASSEPDERNTIAVESDNAVANGPNIQEAVREGAYHVSSEAMLLVPSL